MPLFLKYLGISKVYAIITYTISTCAITEYLPVTLAMKGFDCQLIQKGNNVKRLFKLVQSFIFFNI